MTNFLNSLKDWLPVLVAVGGWMYTLFTDHAKIKRLSDDVRNLQQGQTTLAEGIKAINLTLADISAKMTLLLDGKIKLNEEK